MKARTGIQPVCNSVSTIDRSANANSAHAVVIINRSEGRQGPQPAAEAAPDLIEGWSVSTGPLLQFPKRHLKANALVDHALPFERESPGPALRGKEPLEHAITPKNAHLAIGVEFTDIGNVDLIRRHIYCMRIERPMNEIQPH